MILYDYMNKVISKMKENDRIEIDKHNEIIIQQNSEAKKEVNSTGIKDTFYVYKKQEKVGYLVMWDNRTTSYYSYEEGKSSKVIYVIDLVELFPYYDYDWME